MKRMHSNSYDNDSSHLSRSRSLDPGILWRESSFNAFQDAEKTPALQRSMTDAMEMMTFLPSLPSLSPSLKRGLDNDDTLISFWPSASDLNHVLEGFSQDIEMLEKYGYEDNHLHLPDLALDPRPVPAMVTAPFSFPSGFIPFAPFVPSQPAHAQPANNQAASSQPRPQATESQGSGRQIIPKHKKDYLNNWIESRFSNPYASDEEKAELSSLLDLSPATIFNYLINARTRSWKPQLLNLWDENQTMMERAADEEWKEKIKNANRDPALIIPCLLNNDNTRGMMEAKEKKGETECKKLASKMARVCP